MRIRAELPADIDGVFAVVSQAFGRDDEARLVNALRQEPDAIGELSLVAVEDLGGAGAAKTASADDAVERVVGHVLFSPLTIGPAPNGTPGLALAPVSVVPDRQRQGIGKALVAAGIEVARSLGHAIVVVVGHPEYYPKFGFAPARARGLEAPFPVSDAAFMVLELQPEALESVSGMVHYSPPFGIDLS